MALMAPALAGVQKTFHIKSKKKKKKKRTHDSIRVKFCYGLFQCFEKWKLYMATFNYHEYEINQNTQVTASSLFTTLPLLSKYC